MCKKQTSVSHSSTESEIVFSDAGLRVDGLPALDLWDVVIEVLRSTQGNANSFVPSSREIEARPKSTPKPKQIPTKHVDLLCVDQVLVNAHSSHGEPQFCIFNDNETVIKMIIEGVRPTMRHVPRTHRVALDWLFDRINLDPKIQIKYVETKNQLADMFTKGSFPRDKWNNLLHLLNIMIFRLFLAAISFFLTERRV